MSPPYNRRASLPTSLANKSCYAMVYYELYLLNNIGSLFIRFSVLLYIRNIKIKQPYFVEAKFKTFKNINSSDLSFYINVLVSNRTSTIVVKLPTYNASPNSSRQK